MCTVLFAYALVLKLYMLLRVVLSPSLLAVWPVAGWLWLRRSVALLLAAARCVPDA
jgi:hypothetical protein